MRLICLQRDLSAALNIVIKAVNTNNTLPVLNNILLKAEGKKLYFTATNLEIAISYWIEIDIKNEGETTIPAKLLTNYINYLKDEKLDIAVGDGNVMTIKTSDSSIKIKGISPAEFPPIPSIEKEGSVVLDKDDLKKAVKQVTFAASLNTTRPILGGIYCYIEKDNLVMAATDSYRLAEKKIKPQKHTGVINCLLPARTLIELGNILDGAEKVKKVEIIISKNQVLFIVGEIKVISRLIEGQFPNYRQILPRQSKTQINFNTGELALALKRINLFAKENNNKVIFKAQNDNLIVTTNSTQFGEGEIILQSPAQGETNEIALNSQYLLDVLNNIESPDVVMEIDERNSPIVLKFPQQADYFHIIMPLKI